MLRSIYAIGIATAGWVGSVGSGIATAGSVRSLGSGVVVACRIVEAPLIPLDPTVPIPKGVELRLSESLELVTIEVAFPPSTADMV